MGARKLPTKTEEEILAPIREATALALASGFSEAEASKKTGAAPRLIKTWRTDSTFVHRISEIRGELSQRVHASVSDKMLTALTTLDEVCRHSGDEAARLAAAKLLLEIGMRMQRSVEFEQRITVHQAHQQEDNKRLESPVEVSPESTQESKNDN